MSARGIASVPVDGRTPVDRCRHCAEPIHLVESPGGRAWLHSGPRGAFACRDTLTGMCLPTYAEPAPDLTGGPPNPGRHRA